jgi:hypothetical protein
MKSGMLLVYLTGALVWSSNETTQAYPYSDTVICRVVYQVCDLPVDGAKAGLKRGNTPMIVKECYDGREDRSWQTEPA